MYNRVFKAGFSYRASVMEEVVELARNNHAEPSICSRDVFDRAVERHRRKRDDGNSYFNRKELNLAADELAPDARKQRLGAVQDWLDEHTGPQRRRTIARVKRDI